MATIAERVARLSPIPAASLPSVVPLHGQITTASIAAEPDADLAAMSSLFSRIAPVFPQVAQESIPRIRAPWLAFPIQ